jgi:hypothetical protein
VLAIDGAQVAAADLGRAHLDQHLPWAGLGSRDLAEFDATSAGEVCTEHARRVPVAARAKRTVVAPRTSGFACRAGPGESDRLAVCDVADLGLEAGPRRRTSESSSGDRKTADPHRAVLRGLTPSASLSRLRA